MAAACRSPKGGDGPHDAASISAMSCPSASLRATRMPGSAGAEYRFGATIDDVEATLSAERRGGAPGEHFWHHPFEDAAFGSVADPFAAFHRGAGRGRGPRAATGMLAPRVLEAVR
jgi:hypothetical protein